MYNAYVTTIKNLRKHPNADRLQLGECFGNTVCVSMEYIDGQIGIYFPTDGQLSVEFAEQNNLLRKKDENGNNIGGYMDSEKRNITAIKLRGEKSDGLFLPIKCIEYTGVDMSTIRIGDVVNTVNGHEICNKYIPRKNPRSHSEVKNGNKTRKHNAPISPLFNEHADTEQLAYNLSAFKPGDQIEITLKMHGSSQRSAHLPVFKGYATPYPWANMILKYINPNKKTGSIAKKLYEAAMKTANPVYDWGYVSGTRRTVLENYEGGYYGSNEFREQHSKFFEGKLHKNEEIFYEVTGFTHTGSPIMASADNKKLNDKEFIKQYGKTTVFSYGCVPNPHSETHCNDSTCGYQNEPVEVKLPQSDIYVYRMTMTNEDGNVVEYTPDFMRYRCEQIGAKCVPVMWSGKIPDDVENAGEWVKDMAEKFYDGPDPIGKTHVREGVVVRIVNRPKFAAYKLKNFSFKCLEGLVKAEAIAPDMEEAEDCNENEI